MVTIRNFKYAGSGRSPNRHPSRIAVAHSSGCRSSFPSDLATSPGYAL